MGSVLVSSGLALVLWGNFVYKLRRFRGHPRDGTQRANSATLLCMALAFTILDPPVYAAVDAVTGIPNLARLLGNECGVVGACAFEPVAAAVAKRTGRGGGVWGNWWFMGATLLVMMALFIAAHLPTSEPTAGFPVRYDALPAVAAYRLVFLGAIGLTLCRLFLLWCRVSVAASVSGPTIQRQAYLQTVGWALGAGYCGYECGYILLRAVGVASALLYSSVLAYTLLVGCFALLLNDGFLTAWRWVDHYCAYYALGPLWRALVAAFPHLALDLTRRSAMPVSVLGDLDFRLRRRVTEVRDGVMTLQPFLDQAALDRVRVYYGIAPSTQQPARGEVAALTLAAAMEAKQQGQRARHRLTAPLLPDATDFDTDLRHLRAVAAAYRHLPPEDIMAVTIPTTDSPGDANASPGIGSTAPPPRSRRMRTARVLTEMFAPSPVGVVALVVVAWRFSPTPLDAIKWVGVSAAFVIVLPLAHLLWRVRRGQVTDLHVRRRDQRLPVMLAFLASWCASIVVLTLLGAPRPLVALIGTGMAALVVTGLITLHWKISLHVGVAAGVLTVFALLFGPRVLLLAPLIPALGWARVTLGDHTPWQVTAGALVGALISGGAFTVVLTILR